VVIGRASGLVVRHLDDDGAMRGRLMRRPVEEAWGRLLIRKRACCCRWAVEVIVVEGEGDHYLDENRG